MYPNTLPLNRIIVRKNPRRYFDPAEMAELTESVRQNGVLQSVLIRPFNNDFELIAGGRRYTAAMNAHGEAYEIPVNVKEMTDAEAEEYALIENVHRADMSPAEEAEAAAKVLARCEGDRDEAANRLGWTRSTLDKRLALMNCCQAVRDALVERKIKLGHAELIAALAKERQEGVLQAVLSSPALPAVDQLKEQIQKLANAMSAAIFDKSDCVGCAHNSGNQQALFGEAVADGHCTNRDCWNEKTDSALEAIKDGLKDEYPEIRIVRPGENFLVIKLIAEGTAGVGDEQAQACRSCSSFGAAISGVPGKVGNIYKGLCFDAACNESKVKANQKAILDAAKPAQQEGTASDGGKSTSANAKADKPAAKVAKPTASVQNSTRVKEYRVKVWRKALAKHLVNNPDQNERVLLAVAMAGDGRHISGTKVKGAFEALTKVTVSGIYPTDMLSAVDQAPADVLAKMRLVLTASVAEDIDEHKLIKLLVALKVKLTDHWGLCEDYLNLLTKSEIEVIAEQLGIKSHAGKDFTKIIAGKKDEIVKKLLAVEGFEYSGKLPENMKFAKA